MSWFKRHEINCFIIVDGAFDDAISKLLSPPGDYLALTRFVQSALYQRSRGFLAPGSAAVLRLPESIIDGQKETTGCSHLVICPTMHWPQDVSWDRYVVYNTVWAMLSALDRHNVDEGIDSDRRSRSPIRSLLMPGLGTGTGNLPYRRFASQFALAGKHFDEAVRNPSEWSSIGWKKISGIIDAMERTLDDSPPDADGH